MPDVSFLDLAIVAGIAFGILLPMGLVPRLRLPSSVLEIVAGILVGPAVVGWVKPDLPVQILALIGVAFLLFLAGLEIELDRLRGPVLPRTGITFLLSFGIALAAAFALRGAGQAQTPLFVAIVLVATSLGIVPPSSSPPRPQQSAFRCASSRKPPAQPGEVAVVEAAMPMFERRCVLQ